MHNRLRSGATTPLDNRVRVSTPENIAFHYEVAGPFRRFLAYIVDVVIALVAYFAIALLIGMLFAFLAIWTDNTPLEPVMEFLAELASAVMFVAAFLCYWFYGAYMETNFNGQTFGKMMGNIRSISTDGSAIDGSQATLRNFFRFLDVFPIVPASLFLPPGIFVDEELSLLVSVIFIPTFGFGLIAMALNRKYQRLGDLVANTIVVTEEKKWKHGLAKFSDARIAQLATEAIPHNFAVSTSLAAALAEYVDRRQVLPYQRAVEVASHLGRPLTEHLGLPANTNHDLLLCALYYKTFIDDPETNDRLQVEASPAKAVLSTPMVEAGSANIARRTL